MSGGRITNDLFYMPEIHLGRAYGPPTIKSSRKLPNDNPFSTSVIPYDYHAFKQDTPLAHPFGIVRLPRRNQGILVAHVQGHAQNPIAFMHAFNFEQRAGFMDPAPTETLGGPPLVVRPDDFAIYHDETFAFMRFRNPSAGVDGSPAFVEHLRMQSGFSIIASEYAPPSVTMPPTAPTRAKYAVTMPQGATLTIDEPADDQTVVTLATPSGFSFVVVDRGASTTGFKLTHPSGAVVEIGPEGGVTVSSPKAITLESTDVQLGTDDGKTLAFFAELNALTSWASTHTHTGVQSGSSTSGTPMTSPPTPVGTQDTYAT